MVHILYGAYGVLCACAAHSKGEGGRELAGYIEKGEGGSYVPGVDIGRRGS